MRSDFMRGIYHGIPIALGYISVSFGFGITAVASGLSIFEASAISLTNMTSAGQAAGIDIIAAGGSIFEMILVQLIVNVRYSLMGLSLTQKLDKSFTLPHRMAASFGITDEIFAVCSAQPKFLCPAYMYGMIFAALVAWVLGTFLGASAGQLLPQSISSALGILLYGMFLAIIIPPSRKQKSVLCVVVTAAAMSLAFKYIFTAVSSGFAVIICAVAASALGAVLFPIKETENEI